jgi:hypothetical protein
VVTAVGWTLVAVSVTGLVGVFGWLAKARYTPLPSLSSRGEEAGVPEERDEEMAVARAAKADDFKVWEAECSKLQRLADRLGSRP